MREVKWKKSGHMQVADECQMADKCQIGRWVSNGRRVSNDEWQTSVKWQTRAKWSMKSGTYEKYFPIQMFFDDSDNLERKVCRKFTLEPSRLWCLLRIPARDYSHHRVLWKYPSRIAQVSRWDVGKQILEHARSDALRNQGQFFRCQLRGWNVFDSRLLNEQASISIFRFTIYFYQSSNRFH
jgi:hypothetical protein